MLIFAVAAVTSAEFTFEELPGTYARYLAFPGSETLCPTEIVINEAAPTEGDDTTYTVKFGDLEHDGFECDDDGALIVGPAAQVLADPGAQAALEKDAIGVVKGAAAALTQSTTSLASFQTSPTSCGEAPSLPASTGYFFVDEDEDVVLVPELAILVPGYKYVALFVQTDVSIGCLYNESKAAASPSPAAASSDADSDTSADEASPTPASDSDDGVCFPASASVQLESGSLKRMDELVIGDRVAVSDGVFSEVFAFTHKDAAVSYDFVQISTASGATLTLTPSHYIYANGHLIAAKDVVVGDSVELSSGLPTTVTNVATARDVGLYNPQTVHGDIIVNGIRASTYTTAVQPSFAHAALYPMRALFQTLGLAPLSLATGASAIVQKLPSGVSEIF